MTSHIPLAWQMLVRIPMDRNSSSPRQRLIGLIGNIQSLDESFRGWTLCTRSRMPGSTRRNLSRTSRSLTSRLDDVSHWIRFCIFWKVSLSKHLNTVSTFLNACKRHICSDPHNRCDQNMTHVMSTSVPIYSSFRRRGQKFVSWDVFAARASRLYILHGITQDRAIQTLDFSRVSEPEPFIVPS